MTSNHQESVFMTLKGILEHRTNKIASKRIKTWSAAVSAAVIGLLLIGRAAPAWSSPSCTNKCGFTCDAIANGPFVYANESGATSATFIGNSGSAVSLSFNVSAPNSAGDIVVFPGQGQNACSGTADATVGVLEITQVADANGKLLNPPIDIGSTNPSLFTQIADAFRISLNGVNFTPSSVSTSFTPGSSDSVYVDVSNPGVDSSEYGEYDVKLAAQAPGAGIGVGPGIQFDLTLKAPSLVDNTPCVLTINSPSTAAETLGPLAVSIQAYDPSPGSGLASLKAWISSAGGAVSKVNIPLTLDSALPAAAGVTVNGSGSYTPTGGTGTAGTADSLAFASSSRSGIGTYTVTATCTDVAGNIGQAKVTFAVNYAVSFTDTFVPNGCKSSNTHPCRGMFKFDVNRSNTTSDGAFMFDHTVKVNLVSTANSTSNSCSNSSLAVQSHPFGTGSINSQTQINANPEYQTNFDGGNISIVPFGSYVAQACFLDVDGKRDLQGTSSSVNF
jgi:hypothetical protein